MEIEKYFTYDSRLGIYTPHLLLEWDQYSENVQHALLLHWEKIRGNIPDRIAELEHMITKKQAHLSNESNFQLSCQINTEISELASVINDLWLWYRANQNVTKTHL